MKFLYSDDPIIAFSTSTLGNAAISVIRISGFTQLSSFNRFFSVDLSGPIEPRRVYLSKLVLQGQVIDDICFTYFKAPKSYNGENVLELSVHGNLLNVERILDLFIEYAGCRLAEPGEFTFRALKNKKLTLSQVEGLDLFLNANSRYALDQGLSLLNGNLHELYQQIYDLFVIHKSSLELFIDFSEDVGEEAARKYFFESLSNLKRAITTLAKRVRPLDHNLICPEIVIAGLPNSGKSSLFNFFLSEERAIVSSRPGTTRDYLAETIVIKGNKYKLIDTAGIRDSSDTIESEGVKRAHKILKSSFFSILLINPFEILENFHELIKNKFDLILYTHSDLPGFAQARLELEKVFPSLGPIGAVSLVNPCSEFESVLRGQINKKYEQTIRDKPILLSRHKTLILEAERKIEQYQILSDSLADVGILSHELNMLGDCFSELIGIITPDNILNSVFENFCIGK